MSILIDSAIPEEVRDCVLKFPWVKSLSTNPKLLKIAAVNKSPLNVLEQLSKLVPGVIYYQVTSITETDLIKECKKTRPLCKFCHRIHTRWQRENNLF